MAATTRPTIGFVGLGHMGGNMAARLLAAGYTVHGKARRRAPAQWLVDQGLRWRDTPREIAEAADIVFTSLPNDRVLEAVASGVDGILAGLSARNIWVDMSTVSPRTSRTSRRACVREEQPCSTRPSPAAFPRCRPER